MASTGDDGSETDSVPDEVFRRSSSAVAGGEEDVQYAQDPKDDEDEVPQQFRQNLDEQADEPEIAQQASEEYSSDQSSERENRFQGPASTWLFYTESERELAASLDQARANDLSIHLYNVHALKARVRDPEASSKAQHHRGKKQWVKPNEAGTLPWHPEANWTAWPMRPEDVPRSGERFGVPITSRDDERATYKMPVSWKPSADLEGEIQALMQNRVKSQMRTHQRQLKVAQESLPLRTTEEFSPRKRKRSASSISSESSSEDIGNVKLSLPHLEHRDSIFEDDDGDDDDQWPEILLDDDNAAEILQPNVRQIISKLDDLLLGLHRSRKSYGRESTIPRSRSRNERKKSQSKQKSQSVAAQTGEADSSDQDLSSSSSERPSRSGRGSRAAPSASASQPIPNANMNPQGGQNPKRKRPLNPRDWSEVLGTASLMGWNADVIQRAAARCADLFGESMVFAAPDEPGEREADDGADTGQLGIEESEEEMGYACPFETCARHTEAWPLKKTWRWREHLKRVHKYSKEDVENLEAELKSKRTGDEQDHAASDGSEEVDHGEA